MQCLIDNGRRHARTTVTMTVTSIGRVGQVAVADDGRGVPTGDAERIFEPFVSLDGRGGTGVGLAIARRLVENEGGTLRYTGDAFVITLPLAPRGTRPTAPHPRRVTSRHAQPAA
jgi:signal transduction histidine kinase